jgi:hypothetical protein
MTGPYYLDLRGSSRLEPVERLHHVDVLFSRVVGGNVDNDRDVILTERACG